MKNRITIDKQGAVTIPDRLREAFGLGTDDELIVEGRVTDILVRRLCVVGTPLTSNLAIEEARRNLQRKRPAWLSTSKIVWLASTKWKP